MKEVGQYKLASLQARSQKTIVRIGEIEIGGNELALIGGPCSVESMQQTFEVAEHLQRLGIRLFRGGCFKPRTSPYTFQGLGEVGLKILAQVRERFGLRIVTEALDSEHVALVERYADVIQVGARNMQNYPLLRRVGRSHKPVLLKRGIAATIDEFLLAAEYILAEGNPDVVLCERGIRTFATHTRFTLDVGIVPALRERTHLPVIVDPSHATGSADKVIPLARAGIAAGADGLIVEVHCQPEAALSDGEQAITPLQFAQMAHEVQQIASVLHGCDVCMHFEDRHPVQVASSEER